jgi:3-oxoacyl-[acyl-carrier-protein] synthase-3
MSAAVVGLGAYLPETVRRNEHWPSTFRERRAGPMDDRTFNDIPAPLDPVAAAIIARDLALEASDPMLGTRLRRVADETLSSAQAEAWAAQAALKDAGVTADQVDVLLSYAAVPDRIAPATGTQVAALIGAHAATVIPVDTACASALTQLDVARAYVEAGLAKVVLLTQSHLLLRALPTLHPATPGLGDAASALVVSAGEGLSILGGVSRSHGDHALSVTWVRGPDAATDLPWWKAGGDMRLGSRNPEGAKFLMRETVSFGARTVQEIATRTDLALASIEVLASVQPRGFIPHAIAERLGIGRERAVTTYDELAHVGCCGPVLNLMKARAEGRLRKGAVIALYAQGTGFTRAATLLQVSKSAST